MEAVGSVISLQGRGRSDSKKERLQHGDLRFDSLLDLVKRETELTPGLHRRELVFRGGNIASDTDQLLGKERDKQFSIEPGARTVILMLGQVAHLGKGLSSLKHQLNLPSHTLRV
jgi:hypothetical protein